MYVGWRLPQPLTPTLSLREREKATITPGLPLPPP